MKKIILVLVLFIASIAIANVPLPGNEDDSTQKGFKIETNVTTSDQSTLIFSVNLNKHQTATPYIWQGQKQGQNFVYAIASQPIDKPNDSNCNGSDQTCQQLGNLVGATLNAGKILQKMLKTQVNSANELSQQIGNNIINVSSAPGSLIDIDYQSIPAYLKSPDGRFTAVIMKGEKRGRWIWYSLGTGKNIQEANKKAQDQLRMYLDLPPDASMSWEKNSKLGNEVWSLWSYTEPKK